MADNTENKGSDPEAAAPAASEPYVDPKGRKIGPRQRRLALRRARGLGLEPADGHEAVRMLVDRGFDVFSDDASILDGAQAAPLEGQKKPKDEKQGKSAFPVPTPAGHGSGLTEAGHPPIYYEREIEVAKIQRDLVQRRRRRLQLLVMRLLFFVCLPTAIAGHYYYNIATPLYETNSSFVIQTSGAASGGLGGLLAGTGFATAQDSIVVQDYLLSREAFLRLEAEFNYADHFRKPEIDPLKRLEPDAGLDEAYTLYQRNVSIGYDPTEGVIRMKIIATTPEDSRNFSNALVRYAEARVDTLSLKARGDQVDGAFELYEKSERDMLAAQAKVLDLQQQRGILSAEAEIASQMSIINGLEASAEDRRLALAEVLDNARPNPIRVSALEREIARIEERVAELRFSLTESTATTLSLARISAELSIAESELATRQLLLQKSLEQLETARLEASSQVRYLSMGVVPIATINPTYPKKLEGTMLAFLVFASIYVLVSLTLSVLREQVSV